MKSEGTLTFFRKRSPVKRLAQDRSAAILLTRCGSRFSGPMFYRRLFCEGLFVGHCVGLRGDIFSRRRVRFRNEEGMDKSLGVRNLILWTIGQRINWPENQSAKQLDRGMTIRFAFRRNCTRPVAQRVAW